MKFLLSLSLLVIVLTICGKTSAETCTATAADYFFLRLNDSSAIFLGAGLDGRSFPSFTALYGSQVTPQTVTLYMRQSQRPGATTTLTFVIRTGAPEYYPCRVVFTYGVGFSSGECGSSAATSFDAGSSVLSVTNLGVTLSHNSAYLASTYTA
eukprot:TRINITY_DN354_c0_g1_i1.p1 TRINITY_DN354_c0_g1~~TRINITY_DN354_c0_g1_i1.p1  ORF type:complete len:153 (-),score=27.63 TRINITY_DN354_c0_g1_i1:125-583(-)